MKSLDFFTKKLLAGFLFSRQFLPASCLLCFCQLTSKHYLCTACYQALAKNTLACHVCAEPLTTANLALCPVCTRQRPAFNQVFAPWLYEQPYKQLVREFKYQQQLLAGYFILQLLQQQLSPLASNYQLLTVVPGQKNRLRKRGLHAPSWLAKRLGLLVNLPFEPKALVRIKNIASQQKLAKKARWLNPAGALTANPQLVAGKRVLLLDDVLTTGASCHWAAEALLSQGASQVDVLVAARTPK